MECELTYFGLRSRGGKNNGESVNMLLQPHQSKGHSNQHKKIRFTKMTVNTKRFKDKKLGQSQGQKGPQPHIKKSYDCWFCQKEAHKKKDCL